MSLVMEEQSQPVFRDFLGPAPPAAAASTAAAAPGPGPEPKQPEFSATDSVRVSQNSGFMEPEDGEASVRGGSTFSAAAVAAPGPSSAAPGPSLDPETEIWRGSKAGASPFSKAMSDEIARKRDELASRGPYREALNDPGEGSRPAKISRFKQRDTEPLPTTGDLSLAMQPPRPGQASNMWLQASVFKPENSKRMDSSSRPSSGGVPMMARPIQVGAGAPPASAAAAPPPGGIYSRNPGSSSMQPPPADEGSRTGLQGGGIAALINNAGVKLPSSTRPVGEPSILERSASLERPKLPLQNGVPDSLLPSHKTSTTSATRQLTIFYGGHAHVFDDVSPEKADAIMQLAGSNGRSWSTSYAAAHRSSRSEGSLIDLERRRDKPVNHQNGSSSLGVPAEMTQNSHHSLQNLSYSGIPRKHHRMAPEHPASKHPADVPLPSVDGNRYAAANGRAANLHSSYYNVKEASGNGQHWL